ncbi:MAG: DinB family protein, partial [Bacteroidales bacterium]|nr:DinB family protein [Bacteroidales bacterium]
QMEGFAHTVWELTEHLRLALHDLVEYSKDSHFQSPPWPDGYWPKNPAPASEKEWQNSLQQINDLREEMIRMVQDTSNDLFEPFKANPDHNLLRQATIAAEHTAYHGGQIAMLSKAIERQQ